MVVGGQPRRCGRSCEEVGRAQAVFFRIIVGKSVFDVDVRVLGLIYVVLVVGVKAGVTKTDGRVSVLSF